MSVGQTQKLSYAFNIVLVEEFVWVYVSLHGFDKFSSHSCQNWGAVFGRWSIVRSSRNFHNSESATMSRGLGLLAIPLS